MDLRFHKTYKHTHTCMSGSKSIRGRKRSVGVTSRGKGSIREWSQWCGVIKMSLRNPPLRVVTAGSKRLRGGNWRSTRNFNREGTRGQFRKSGRQEETKWPQGVMEKVIIYPSILCLPKVTYNTCKRMCTHVLFKWSYAIWSDSAHPKSHMLSDKNI